jgi:hypothetical protein
LQHIDGLALRRQLLQGKNVPVPSAVTKEIFIQGSDDRAAITRFRNDVQIHGSHMLGSEKCHLPTDEQREPAPMSDVKRGDSPDTSAMVFDEKDP